MLWRTETPPARPISPVVTDSGIIVLATKGGPISAYRGSDGTHVGTLALRVDPDRKAIFETVNTPCVQGDRIYVATQRSDEIVRGPTTTTGRLVAIDVHDADGSGAPAGLAEAWHFEFGAPSGGSPLCIGSTIYFDGAGLSPHGAAAPHVFAVRDDGAAPAQVFAVKVDGPIQASPSQDPRGGFWVFATKNTALLHLDERDGHEIERLDLDALVDAPGIHQPSSVMTMAGSDDQPVMLVGAIPIGDAGATYATALDLSSGKLLWKVQIASSKLVDWTASQFAIAHTAAGKPLVVFPGLSSGAFAVGE